MAQRPVVMVVDDDEAVLGLIDRLAQGEGFDVVTCAGGRQAMALLQQQKVDLVMVDLRMPDIGGLDVILAIRESDPQFDTFVHFLAVRLSWGTSATFSDPAGGGGARRSTRRPPHSASAAGHN